MRTWLRDEAMEVSHKIMCPTLQLGSVFEFQTPARGTNEVLNVEIYMISPCQSPFRHFLTGSLNFWAGSGETVLRSKKFGDRPWQTSSM